MRPSSKSTARTIRTSSARSAARATGACAWNAPSSACPACLGLGIYVHVHPDLLVPDKTRSIKGGAFIPEAFRYDKNTWGTRLLNSVAQRYGFSLDTPFQDLSPAAVEIVLYGTKGERVPVILPEGAAVGD